MNEHDALFQSILESPDDDAPRLVYADWLEEHGQPERAEFIRLQIEAARLPFYEPRHFECESLAQQLLEQHEQHARANSLEPTWLLRFPADMERPMQTFRRGFVEAVTLSDRQFLAVAEDCFRQTPLREARFFTFAGPVRELLTSPYLHRLTAIELAGNQMIGLADEEMLRTVRLPGLRRLGLAETGLTARELEALAELAELPGLRELDLTDNPLGVDGLAPLANSPQLAGLHVLHLAMRRELDYADRIRAAGIGHLAQSPYLRELRELGLRGQLIGDAGLRAIAESPNVVRLELLDLAENDIGAIGEAGLEALATSPHLGNLRVLNLFGNPIGPAFRELMAWPGLGRLHYLNVAYCGLTESHLRWLADEARLAPDAHLAVNGNAVTPSVARRLRERFGPRVSMDEPG